MNIFWGDQYISVKRLKTNSISAQNSFKIMTFLSALHICRVENQISNHIFKGDSY